jgi:hypothetical protein
MVQRAGHNLLAWLLAQHLYTQGKEMGSEVSCSIDPRRLLIDCQASHLWKVNVGRGCRSVHLCAVQEKAKITRGKRNRPASGVALMS